MCALQIFCIIIIIISIVTIRADFRHDRESVFEFQMNTVTDFMTLSCGYFFSVTDLI